MVGSGISCQYRLCLSGKYSDWHDVTPVPEFGGTFVYVDGVQDDQLVQLQIMEPGKSWGSPAVAQWLQIQMTLGGTNS
jgi:hypothetical protein